MGKRKRIVVEDIDTRVYRKKKQLIQLAQADGLSYHDAKAYAEAEHKELHASLSGTSLDSFEASFARELAAFRVNRSRTVAGKV